MNTELIKKVEELKYFQLNNINYKTLDIQLFVKFIRNSRIPLYKNNYTTIIGDVTCLSNPRVEYNLKFQINHIRSDYFDYLKNNRLEIIIHEDRLICQIIPISIVVKENITKLLNIIEK